MTVGPIQVGKVSLLVGILLPLGLSAQQPEVAGCYDLELGAWTPDFPEMSDPFYMSVAPRIRLGEGPALRWRGDGAHELTAAPGALPSNYRFEFWTSEEPDSIELVWSTGYTGIRARLEASGARLEGKAHTFIDTPGPTHTAGAVARPVSCDAPLPEEHRFRYGFPRGVQTHGGDSIRLGELPPEWLDRPPGSGRAYRWSGSLDSPFSEAEEVRAIVEEDGLVGRIIVEFGDRISHEELLERMIPLYGDPTFRKIQTRSGAEWRHAIWYGRVMEVWLVSGSGGSWPLQLQIVERRAMM